MTAFLRSFARWAALVPALLAASLSQAGPSSDFNADGRSDLLWRNSVTGEHYVYPMQGRTILPGEGYLRMVADRNWRVVGIGNFDGAGGADLLWRNSSTGENYIYFMSGRNIVAEGYLRTVADQDWQVGGVGDFNGDGADDILWRNGETGENYVYLMSGLAIGGEGYLRTVAEQRWYVAGIGDFDGDAKSDILWRHSGSGDNYIYFMDGTQILPSEGFIRRVTGFWEVAGIGDFDADGRSDILWRNQRNGENYVYPMNGLAIESSEGYLRTVAELRWQVAAVGDYDGDGASDILWRHSSSGENYLYPMSGTTILGNEGYLRNVPDRNWAVAGTRVRERTTLLYRMTDLDLRDPHVFINVAIFGCRDVTDVAISGFSFNNELAMAISSDADGDDFLDVSYMLAFDRLNNGAGGLFRFAQGSCLAPQAGTACTMPANPADGASRPYVNSALVQCLAPFAGTVKPYSPPVTATAAPCWVSAGSDVDVDLGLYFLPLRDVQFAATYGGEPSSPTLAGLVRGFLTEADADSLIFPAGMPVVGGKAFSSVLGGGSGNCASFNDLDVGLDGTTPGWWFYFNFAASRVDG